MYIINGNGTSTIQGMEAMNSKNEAVIAIRKPQDWVGDGNPSFRIRIDGRKVGKIKIGPGLGELRVEPGVHTVVVLGGYMRSRPLKVAVEAGSKVVLTMNPLPKNRSFLKNLAIIPILIIASLIHTLFKSPGWSWGEWAALYLPVAGVGLCAYMFLTKVLFRDYWIIWELIMDEAEQDKVTSINTDYSMVSPPNPLCGVNGWLKFFVVVYLYIAPIIFMLVCIMAWSGFFIFIEDYSGRTFFILTLETAVSGFLVWKWIQIARRLRDIQPGVIQEAKAWLKITLGLSIISIPLSYISGMNAEELLPSAIKGVVAALILFAIWYSYFSISKRIKATYPD